MSGLGSTLHIAKDALITNQYGLAVTGNNIANVNNADYSRQSIEQVNKGALPYAGFLFGIGVDASQVTQSVNQLLENRLTGEKSSLSGYEEAESYVSIIEDHFNENSDNSISNIMTNFWNSWNDLSNNPADASERLIVLENGKELSERFNRAFSYLENVDVEISTKMISAVDRINDITDEIAQLNQDIMGDETMRTSNDRRDQRNALLDELGKLIDVDIFEQPNGAVVANVANGLPIVNGTSSYELGAKDDQILWYSSSGRAQNITPKIEGGQIGGWLDVREEVIPKYKAELDELSHEVIWALNSQHAQGAGLEYYSDSLTGNYAVDDSGWLSSLSFGDKVDHTTDLTMWIEDTTSSDTEYSKIEMDVGISQAKISNWQRGSDLYSEDATYKLTVVDGTTIGDLKVAQTDGERLRLNNPAISTGSTVKGILEDSTLAPIYEQILEIGGGEFGKEVVEIGYSGADAKQSAASIAQALNNVNGVTAYASETTATFDVASFVATPPADGLTVQFGIYVDGVTHYESFTVDSTVGAINEQFEDAFLAAAESLNAINGDEDLSLEYDATDATNEIFKLISDSGRTVGLEGIELKDAAGVTVGSAQTIGFSGNGRNDVAISQIGSGAGTTKSAVVVGTLTIETEPGISITSSLNGADGGLIDGRHAEFGSSILTLGGEDGFNGFDPGDTISFDIDTTHSVTMTVPAGSPTQEEIADALYSALIAPGAGLVSLPPVDTDEYAIVQNGLSVSVIKRDDLESPIEITSFSDSSNNAQLAVNTGTGSGTSAPENDMLDADPLKAKQSVTSSLYADEGIILWEEFNKDGFATGKSGLVFVEDAERVSIPDDGTGQEYFSFDLSAGSLVAGNTLSINMNEINKVDAAGVVVEDYAEPDPLAFTVLGDAKSQNDVYRFKVISGGTIGTLPDEDKGETNITIEWDNGITNGTFTIDEPDPPLTPNVPYEVEVDGMTLKFTSGTVITDDVFTITTDAGGKPVSTNGDGEPTGEFMHDWHWTMDSFADQFNKVGQGMEASVDSQNQLVLSTSDSYHVMTNVLYSEDNGFLKDNVSIEVNDWSRLDFSAKELQFSRDTTGNWSIMKDPTGGNAKFLPTNADDDSFGVDFSGDGLADITIRFNEKPSGDGSITLDLERRDPDDIGFAFSDESGMLAALGINTFFTGDNAATMSLNEVIEDTNFLAAATLDETTGEIDVGDNSNTLAMADLQFKSLGLKQWNFVRGKEAESNMTTATLDGYYSTMLGALGVDSKNIQSAREFADLMVNYITEQRDSVSAVSLDEEMVKLIEYQQAFNAASKIVSTTDEMLNTLINLR